MQSANIITLKEDIVSQGVKRTSIPRQIAIYLMREMTIKSLPNWLYYGRKDHSTILYSENKIKTY